MASFLVWKILNYSDLFTIIHSWEKGVTLVVSEPVCQSVGLSDWFVELLSVLLCNSWILLRSFANRDLLLLELFRIWLVGMMLL